MANDIRWGILVAAPDLGDIGELQRAPRGDDRRIGDGLDAVIGAVDPDEDLRPACVSIEPAGVTVFCRCKAAAMSCADTPSVASLA